MAELKKSEARLLMAFGLLIFAAITMFVLKTVEGKKNLAVTQKRAADREVARLEKLIETEPKWTYYRDFVQQYQPMFESEEKHAPALEAYFRSAAGDLEFKKLVFNPPLPMKGNVISVSLQANLRGPGAEVLSFLSNLQNDKRFYAIPSISIVADLKDPSMLTVDMVFARWFTTDGLMPDLDGFIPAPDENPMPAPAPAEAGPATAPPAEPAAEPEPEEKPKPRIVPPPPAAKPPGLIQDPADAPAIEPTEEPAAETETETNEE